MLNTYLDDCVFDVSCDLSIQEVKILLKEGKIVSRYVFGKNREQLLMEKEAQQDAEPRLSMEGA